MMNQGSGEQGSAALIYPEHWMGSYQLGRFTTYIHLLSRYIYIYIYTIWLFNIAMENGPFIDGLPIKNGDFPWLC